MIPGPRDAPRIGSAMPPRRVAGWRARLAGMVLLAVTLGAPIDAWAEATSSRAGDLEQIRAIIAGIKQRTRTRQISGGENLNVMEWTTHAGPSTVMDGAVVYFKKFGSAFGYFNERFGEFVQDLPKEWDDFGRYQEKARAFSGDDIDFANKLIIDLFEWFKPKQRTIGDQGGILIIFGDASAEGSLVAYADPNRYKENNVAGLLTARSYLSRIRLIGDPFRLPLGAGDFVRGVLEDQEGLVRIDVPYVLYRVPAR